MKVKGEGGKREVWWTWEKRGWKLHINSSKIKLLARIFKYIYCKHLHKEKKNAERENTSSLLSML